MSIRINLGKWGSVFAVPTSVVDEHIKIASPLQLKVLLFLLRNSENTYTEEQLAENLSVHIDDVKDSLSFWVQREVIADINGEITPAEGTVENKAKSFTDENRTIKNHTIRRLKKPSLIDTAQTIAGDEKLQQLIAEVESALSKTLGSGDVATIVMLYDTCGLPAEVIAMLVHYCVSINNANFSTIQRIGIEWSDNQINTLEKAENRIQQFRKISSDWNMISKTFGLKNIGSPTKKQLEYAEKWIGEWHFSAEMLRTAYELCVDQTGEVSMPYINKILKRWQSAGIFKVEDIEKLDNKKQCKKAVKSKASYDIEELEKIQSVEL